MQETLTLSQAMEKYHKPDSAPFERVHKIFDIMIDKKLYPVYYKGRYWEKKECGQVFRNFYQCKIGMRVDGAVYAAGGSWVFPDDTFEHDDNRD